jgi:hypothetical protein
MNNGTLKKLSPEPTNYDWSNITAHDIVYFHVVRYYNEEEIKEKMHTFKKASDEKTKRNPLQS